MGWWNKLAREYMNKQYTEYGYRGAKELHGARKEIADLKERVAELQKQLQSSINEADNLRARANIPKY